MTIIEVDGVEHFSWTIFNALTHSQTDVEQSPIDLVNVAVAQRYSVLVTARNDTTSNWVVHANMDTNMFDVVPSTLVYSGCSSPLHDPNRHNLP